MCNGDRQTDRYRQVQTGTDRYRQVQTGTDRYRQVQTGTDRYRQVQTGTDRYRVQEFKRDSTIRGVAKGGTAGRDRETQRQQRRQRAAYRYTM
jgi:hypothetical protein